MTEEPKSIAILGASGEMGRAFHKILAEKYPNANLNAFSQQGPGAIDYTDEGAIAQAAEIASKENPLDLVIVTNGILHEKDLMPEKSLKDLSADKFHRVFAVNAVVPALIAKHFLPKLARDKPSKFCVLSARVGSISDNRLGGWYSYRASKAALNMIVKNSAIEIARTNKQAVVVALHPGTVDSKLSKPFQGNVPEAKLFKAEYSAGKLLEVLTKLSPEQSGKCFAWDGKEIEP